MNTSSFIQKGKAVIAALALIVTASATAVAQDNGTTHRTHSGETFGNTLNLGVGLGYYGYFDQVTPLLSANYEINVAHNFTLAPSVGVASYRSDRYYDYLGGHYYYHRTIVPIALKGSYYFDELLGAGPKWDFYLGASVGFLYSHIVWDNGYYGPTTVVNGTSRLYLDGHIGTEYHASKKVGIFLDLSTGISTVGLAFHM